MFGGYKTGISRLFFKHCEQVDHQPEMQRHLENVEAVEVLDCIVFIRYFEVHSNRPIIYSSLQVMHAGGKVRMVLSITL